MLNRLLAPLFATALVVASLGAQAQGTVYRCPGPPVLYTDALSAKEASDKGCRTIEGTPITVVQTARPRPAAPAAEGARGAESRVDAGQQREYPTGTVARMVIGNASAAHVRVGGALQDLAAFQRANVARFTVSSDGRLQPAAD